MVDVTPSKMFATGSVIEFVAEIAILGVEQEMYKYGERRKRVHGLVKRRAPRRNCVWLLVHENEEVLVDCAPRAVKLAKPFGYCAPTKVADLM